MNYAKWRPRLPSVVLGTRMRKNSCPDYYATMSNSPTLGTLRKCQISYFSPPSGRQTMSNPPGMPGPPPLGLNIDQCINVGIINTLNSVSFAHFKESKHFFFSSENQISISLIKILLKEVVFIPIYLHSLYIDKIYKIH
jgi:hypothetical protein